MKKKKTIVSVTLFGLFFIGMLALAPYLFHKPQSPKQDIVVASSREPKGNPAQNISQTVISEPIPAPAPNLKVVSERKDTRPLRPEPRKISPVNDLLIIKRNQPPKSVAHSVPPVNEAPIQAVKSDPVAAPGSEDTSKTTDQSSPWGVAVLAANSGVDVGVSYRLAELPILGETNLDLVVGFQEAGIGLSKDVYQNLGVGIVGTVAYADGAPEVGIYVKYSF